MPFISIAYQADVSRYEDDDFREYAKRNCNENYETRGKAIEELRTLIKERGECNPRRMDDEYLLRFLRCRRFIPALAHKLMVRYDEFRRTNVFLYNCDAFGLNKVKNIYATTLPESPECGRITLMRFGRWDTDINCLDDVVRCALLIDEIGIMSPKLQILGVSIIVDLEGLGLRHVRQVTPTLASQVVSLMGANFPLHLRALHIINYSWIINSFSYVFKQFVPRAAWERIHFHGSDMNSLHKHIDPRYLPPEYGGYCDHVISCEEWITNIKQYVDEFMVKEMKALGFTVNI